MAKQTINLGSSVNKGDGDPLRTAFTKINENFTELYTALGLATDVNLNLGAFEFNSSVMTTTDSTPITIDQQVNITSDLVMSGAVVPSATDIYDLGSPTRQWRSIYLTGSTVYFDGIPLSVTDDGTIIVNGEVAATPGGAATWDSVTSKPSMFDIGGNVIGIASSETITEETIDGTISQTTTIESQIEIEAESIVIAKRVSQVTDDTVVVTTDEAGSSVTVNNSGVFIKKYAEPDGPNNTSYFQVRTNNGAILEAVEENVADETYGRVIAAQGVVEIATRADGVEKNWGFNYDGTMVVPTNSTILGTNDLTIRTESDGNSGLFLNSSPLVGTAVLYATNNAVITADYDGNRKDWNFDKSGTITVPLLLPKMFTAVLDADHKVGDPITLTGTAWQYGIGFAVNPNGAVETQMDDPTYPSNPGYTVGDIFRFTEVDHGIPGYTFDITLGFTFDNEAGLFVTNPSVTPPPEYPATVESLGAIKFTSNDNSWIFGTNGILTLPQYNQIESVGSNATISLNGVGTNESIIELGTRVDGETITSTFAMHPAYGIDLTSVRDVTITAGYDSATLKYNTWVEAEQAWVDIRNQDAADIAPGTRTWAGLPSYQAYTLLMEFMQNIAPGEIPPPVGMAVIANTAKAAYELWQAEQADIKVTITAKDNTWTFGNDGDLQLPGGASLSSDTVNGFTISQLAIDEETTLSVNFRRSGEIIVPLSIQFNLLDTPTGFVGAQPDSLIIAGNPGKAIDIAPNDGANGTWSFGTDGNLQLPAGGDIVDSNGDSVLGGGGADLGNLEIDSRTILTDIDQDITIQTSYRRTITAVAGPGTGSSLIVVDISEIDDVVEMTGAGGWEVNLNVEGEVPYWKEFAAATTNVMNNTFVISFTGFSGDDYNYPSFAQGTTYTFRKIQEDTSQWTFTDQGTLATPAGGAISHRNNDLRIAVTGETDVIVLGTAAGELIINSDGTTVFPGLLHLNYNGSEVGFIDTTEEGISIGGSLNKVVAIQTDNDEDNELGQSTWLFRANGSIEFPDGSLQTTAYTGGEVSQSVPRSDSAPSASNGQLWFNTEEARMYIKYNDQWVDASPTVLAPPDTDIDVNSITFADATTLTSAYTNKLVNGVHEVVLNSSGVLRLADDLILPRGSRWIKDCEGSGGTTSMRWYNVPDNDTVELLRVYTGEAPDEDGTERVKISLEWQDTNVSGLSITSFNRTEGEIDHKWNFLGDGSLKFPGDADYRIREDEPGLVVTSELGFAVVTNSIESAKSWIFDNVGGLTLPGGNVISTSGGFGISPAAGGTLTLGTPMNRWVFDDDNGSITFPDNTVQTTAYTGSTVQGEYIYEFDGTNTNLTITDLNFNLLYCKTAVGYGGSDTHNVNLPAGTPGQRLVIVNVTVNCTLTVGGAQQVTVTSGPAEFIYTTNDDWVALYGTV